MAYTRRQTQDGVTVMNKDLYDNLQDGIEERGITPEMFGAVGDGVHDDTEAIKRALKCKNKIILLIRGDNYNTSFIRCKFLDSQNAKGGGGICIYNFDSIRDSYNTLFESCYFEKKNTDEILYIDAKHSDKSLGIINIQNCTFKTILSDNNTDRMISLYTDSKLGSHGKLIIKNSEFLIESCNDNIFYDGTIDDSDGIFIVGCNIRVLKSCVGRVGSYSKFIDCYIKMENTLTKYNFFVSCKLKECTVLGYIPDNFVSYVFADSILKNCKIIFNSDLARYSGFVRCSLENCNIEKCKVVNLIQNPKSICGNHFLSDVSISNLFCNFTEDSSITYENSISIIKDNIFDMEIVKIWTSVANIALLNNFCKGLSILGISGKSRVGVGNIYSSLSGSFTLESGNLLLT